MKKNTVRAWIIFAVCLVAYHAVIFLLPFPKTSVFYLSWIFTLIAMLAQVYVMWSAFGQGENARSKFYGFPIARLGTIYLTAQLLLGLLFIALGNVVPIWFPALLYIVLLGLAVLGLVGVETARDEVVRQDTKLAAETSTMRALQSQVGAFPALTQDKELAAALRKLADAMRYSDPVSSDALWEVEATLTTCVDDLARALAEKNIPAATALVEKATITLAERNRLCKLTK